MTGTPSRSGIRGDRASFQVIFRGTGKARRYAPVNVRQNHRPGGSPFKNLQAHPGALYRDITESAKEKRICATGGVHILINNAGVLPLAPVVDGRVEEWDRMIDIHIKGLLYTTSAVFQDMAKRKDGHIVNIGSVASQFAFMGGAVYSGTKFSVRGITDGLLREALAFGVRVATIQPVAVATELVNTILHDGTKKAITATGSSIRRSGNSPRSRHRELNSLRSLAANSCKCR